MPRTTTAAFRASVTAERTGDALAVLLTLDHADLGTPIRVTDHRTALVSRGETFTAFPFELTLPEDSEERPPMARLRLANAARTLTATIRSIDSPPSLLIEVVRVADPDTVEASWADFVLRLARYDARQIEGDVVLEVWDQEPYPAGRFLPSMVPGVF